ncbi:type II toxin-antitoxin system VapC family toxin [Rhizobium sp. FKL33]|uniref:type II toxin-antitoxin system VapC family toxin n=1 Tax=Rhizobium sp. FKL33 TaxID=2562307 RepID=UPI0010C0FE8F|nr:type II toxin-antitoxin system VapC family toxin [Rhizobium sp. FKL33]
MASYLLDTHVWAWAINLDRRLPGNIAAIILDADIIYVSAISVYEICQKVRIGKWPEMEPFTDRLSELAVNQGGRIIDLNPSIARSAGLLDWDHRDPFDRMLAATALEMGLPILSADSAFDGLADRQAWPGRVW